MVRSPISQEFNPRSLIYRCNHLFREILVMVRTPISQEFLNGHNADPDTWPWQEYCHCLRVPFLVPKNILSTVLPSNGKVCQENRTGLTEIQGLCNQ